MDPEAACPTDAPESFAALLRQKLRHFRAGAKYHGAPDAMNPLLWLVFAAAVEILSIIVAPLWLLLVQGIAWWIVLGGLLAKLTYDTRFLNPLLRSMTRWRGSVVDQLRAALLEFFHVIFSAVIAPLSLLLPRKW
jgi:cellulose synthase/poly-beta-1,6-N-acetylglucosamine synthase-like glycosyltransferase